LSFDYEAYQGLWEISIAFGLTWMHSWPIWALDFVCGCHPPRR